MQSGVLFFNPLLHPDIQQGEMNLNWFCMDSLSFFGLCFN